MRKILLSMVFSLLVTTAFGSQMSGGNIIYEYMGPGTGNTNIYRITLFLYRDNSCVGCPVIPAYARIAIFNSLVNTLYREDNVILNSTEIAPVRYPVCILNSSYLEYTIGKYVYTVNLPNSTFGYTITYQRCCRDIGLLNVLSNNFNETVSATYFSVLPGIQIFPPDYTDNSPVFSKDIPVICANKTFSFNMNITDSDGDILVFYFGDAYQSRPEDTTVGPPLGGDLPGSPPYTPVTYANGFSGSAPLGPHVTINSSTGTISGLAPGPGKYLISVWVSAYKFPPPSILSITTRKDFIVNVTSCDVPGVFLNPASAVNCKDLTIPFENQINSDLNLTFEWDFGDPASGPLNTSTLPAPMHTYSAPGEYDVKLIVNKGTACADSGTTKARVYPGFHPGFTFGTPQCINVPVQFTDTTRADYGTVNYWSWDFGDPVTGADVSSLQNPNYNYNYPGVYTVTLTVGSDKGCRETVIKDVTIVDDLKLGLGNDTLICSIDTLELKIQATGTSGGSITWSPNYMIDDIHSFTPRVSPDVTTTYYATFTNNLGCNARDSITVNVVDFVTLLAQADTTVCTGDAVKLAIISDGLHYVWTPATDLNNPLIKDPVSRPLQDRIYSVTASIGGCSSTASVFIKAVDYPKANAGQDTLICQGTSGYLHASGGAYYSWSPAVFLSARNIPNPVVVKPTGGVKYVVTVRDTLGCPKPVTDTVLIRVVDIKANAGPRDTVVVIGQPLQLNATGASNYVWEPATWLNNSTISNPIALPEADIEYRLRATDASGCYGLDSISVKFYNLKPGLYIPNAFTPNGDGMNDFFRPTLLGMKTLLTFKIYNRLGQLVYSGTHEGKGWDGKVKGAPQSADTFVWYAEGIDYLDKKIQRKGSVVLIR